MSGSGLGGSTGAGVAGGASPLGGRGVAGGASGPGGVAGASPNGGASRLGRLVSGLPLPAHDHETPATGGELDDYLRLAWATDHLDPAGNPHAQYATDAALTTALEGYLTPAAADALFLTPAEGDARYAAAGSGVDAYTKAQSDARYEPLDTAYTKAEADARYLTAAGADALFLTPAEGAAAYAAVDHTHPQVTTGEYHFQTNPAMTDPGTGNFRSNTGAAATATVLAMDQIGAGGTDILTLFQAMRTADTVFVQDKNDAAQWVRYQLTGAATLNSGWATVPVSVISTGGTIAGSQLCVMQLTLTAGGGGGGGGTGLATDALWDAKGDLAVGAGADAAARLAVGTNGQFLTADSAQTSGLAWAANPVTAHTALPDAHHARAHDHTAADGSGALTNEAHDGYSQYANLGADPTTPGTNTIRLYAKDNGSGVATLYYRTEDGTIYELPTLTGGGNGSGAPANAGYVTLAAESKLSQEAVLGSAVIMSGVVASRPAFGTAGRLYLGTDTDLVYRDTGSAWETFADRTPGGGSYLPLAGGTMTGAVVLQGATASTNVAQAKLAADTQPRFRADASGKLEWGPGGSTAPDISLARTAGTRMALGADLAPALNNTYLLGTATLRWSNVYAMKATVNDDAGYVEVGASALPSSGALRLRNTATVAWRNAANNNALSVAMDGSDRLALVVGSGTVTTSATAGAASALPGAPAAYLTVVWNGTAYKLAAWT